MGFCPASWQASWWLHKTRQQDCKHLLMERLGLTGVKHRLGSVVSADLATSRILHTLGCVAQRWLGLYYSDNCHDSGFIIMLSLQHSCT